MKARELLSLLSTVDPDLEVVVHVPERDSMLGGMSREPISTAGEATWTFRGQPSYPSAFEIVVAPR